MKKVPAGKSSPDEKAGPKITVYIDGHPKRLVHGTRVTGQQLLACGLKSGGNPALWLETGGGQPDSRVFPTEVYAPTDGQHYYTVQAQAATPPVAQVERVDFANDEEAEISLTSRFKLTKDLKLATESMTRRQARFLVDAYYQMQRSRIRSGNQVAATEKQAEPHAVLDWLQGNNHMLERQVALALDKYSAADPVGAWSRTVKGVGPVLAAALLAHIDISQVETVGQIWRFMGYDPTCVWGKGERRPWNAALKVVGFKLGESFTRVSGYVDAFYGKIYLQRKAYEEARNDRMENAALAAQRLAGSGAPGKDTEAYKHLVTGKLPPGQLHARAKRYAVKLFIAAWHEVAYIKHHGKIPPLPYPIAHLGHAHKIEPPNPPEFVLEAYRKAKAG